MKVEDMDDLQKLSVYMHYYIGGLTSPSILCIDNIPIGLDPMTIIKMFNQRGVLLIDRTEPSTITDIKNVEFDEFKEKYLNDYYEQYKNEIKLA